MESDVSASYRSSRSFRFGGCEIETLTLLRATSSFGKTLLCRYALALTWSRDAAARALFTLRVPTAFPVFGNEVTIYLNFK